MKQIAVFCGSSPGLDPFYIETAFSLGKELGSRGIGLIYGGAKVGLMGAVADGALAAGARVTGVLPGFLEKKEIAHAGLSELILVDSMHERKTRMYELADGIVTLPGGYGTLDETFEVLTWAQLGLHTKPVGLFNCGGFYDGILRQLDTMVAAGLLKPVHRRMLLTSGEIADLLDQMGRYVAEPAAKWVEAGQA